MDSNKYKYLNFSKNKDIDLKIKYLMLMLDYEVFMKDFSNKEQIQILNKWIEIFKVREDYELIEAFEYRLSILHVIGEENIKTSDYIPYKTSIIKKVIVFIKTCCK